MKRAWLLLPLAALATLVIVPLTTVFGDDEPPEPSVFAVDLGADFTYQGLFKDGGDPANGTYDIRFILYDADSGGAQVGSTVTVEDIEVTDGLFTTTLDFGASSFNGDARWLEIAVRDGASSDTFTVLNPRQPITAVPYALHALTSGGFTVPLDISGTEESAALLTVSQDGDGEAATLERAATDTFGNALSVVNNGNGAAIFGSSPYDGGVAGQFAADTALLIDGAVKVGVANPPAFKIYAETGVNTCDSDTALVIASPLANDDPNAIILVTFDGSQTTPPATPMYVEYDTGTDCPDNGWVVRYQGGDTFGDDHIVNVFILTATVLE